MDPKNLRNSDGKLSLKEIYSDSTLSLTVINQGVCVCVFLKENWSFKWLKVSLKYNYLKCLSGGCHCASHTIQQLILGMKVVRDEMAVR